MVYSVAHKVINQLRAIDITLMFVYNICGLKRVCVLKRLCQRTHVQYACTLEWRDHTHSVNILWFIRVARQGRSTLVVV